MKLFAEYLIEKNIVSTEQLVAALIRQTSRMPGMAEVAYNKKLLRPDQIFKIMKLQNQTRCGFIEAAKELNIWNDSVSEKFEKSLYELRTPLVQILVEMEAAKIETVTHALDEFLGDVQDQFQENKNQPSESKEEVSTIASDLDALVDEISATAPEEEQFDAVEPLDNEINSSSDTESYFDFFTEERKSQIENHFHQLENGGISIPVMEAIRENLHVLSTSARTMRLMMSAGVLQGMLIMVEQILKTPATNMNEGFIARIGKVNIDAIEFLWDLSVKIRSGTSEEEFIQKPENKKRFEAVAAAVEITRFDLDFLA